MGQLLKKTEAFLYEQIPLTRAMQVRVTAYDEKGLTLSAPLSPNENHLRTAFGGSLAALAMLAGYSLLWLELQDDAAHIVISESRLRFLRPVAEELRAVCARPNESRLKTFKEELRAKGKARISLDVTITADGDAAVIFSGIYVARR